MPKTGLGKPNERMLDCYMSPKQMWEGIKALPQLQIHTENGQHYQERRIKVGPFYVSNMVMDESDLQLIQYVFGQSRGTVFSSPPRLSLNQSEFTTLGPQTHLNSSVIDIFADILTNTERRNKSKHLNWYLPVTFSNAALDSSANLSSFLDFVQEHNIKDNYMPQLVYCEKIFIPVHVEYYYLYIIHMKSQEIEIWDSLCHQSIDKAERDKTTKKLLFAMDRLFGDGMFTKFHWRMASNIPLQPNKYDCGVFVINNMQQLDNYVRKKPPFQFDSDKERLTLALKLLKSDLNQEKETLYDEAAARRHYSKVEESGEDLGLCGTKRKRVNTCKTILEGFERGAYMELDSNDRVKRNNNADSKTECVKGFILPTTDLGGRKVQTHTQQIWEWIMNNEVSAIGIWGMAGIGKTALATHVNNKLLEEAGDDFDHIIWVTMSQSDNRVCQLQKAIARSINLDISDDCDVKTISGKLLRASKHINKCVLILDNVWDPVFLEEVGFPLSSDGIKLILTTRSWEVCQSMNCMENTINVKPLDEEDGWDLFKKNFGIHQIQSSRLEPIARAVAKHCEGSPLAILTIARSMRAKQHIKEWNHLLECFQSMDNGQYHMDERLFSVLKSSYACLNNKLLRFFLYYALSAKIYAYDGYVETLIRKFFYEEWTDEMKSLDTQSNEGYTMLNKLKNNSLLTNKNGRWRMHRLLRVIPITMANKTSEIMSKVDMNLAEIPENGEWKENLQKVFLSSNNIQRIPDGTSPKCSKLSTLLLDHNYDLKWIPDDFFSNMPTLKILDLSMTRIKRLPESVSNLECLIALLLFKCEELSYVPLLAKLQRLIELDLSFTAITVTPCGLELLVNLRCLNLDGIDQLKMSSSTISKMSNLQSLRLMNWIPKSIDVRVQDLQGLEKLEVISVNFCDIEEFNSSVKSFLNRDLMLKHYCISSATSYTNSIFMGSLKDCTLKRVVLCGIDLGNKAAVLPEDINELIISRCDHWTRTTCLCYALSFHKNNGDLPKLELLKISKCGKVEYLCCVSSSCSFCSCVQLVETLVLNELKDLKQIVAPFASSLDRPFLYLNYLRISECNKMKIVMTPTLLAQLQNIETIFVEFCELLEEIAGENYYYCSGRSTFNPTLTLPKMRSVELHGLPELTSIFRGTMRCPSLWYFEADGCCKLNPPHIEIVQGCKLQMERDMSMTGYHWQAERHH